MNILDIAIAKKLAGGGGGSGTDNYNDLSNLPKINDTTLSGNKSSSALGLQSEINSDSKLASDLVDDTNQDNKFVTSTEKNTWNAKQNAIDSDHKLSSSLVSFSTAEAAALASGIDSSKVGQISTNQTNISSVLNGVKLLTKYGGGINKLRYNNSTETVGEATFTINDDKSISIYTNGATTAARALVLVRASDNINVDATDIVSGLNSYSGNGIYFGWGIGSSGGDRVLYPNEIQEAIGTSGVMRYFAVYVGSGVNIPQQNAFTVNPMIVSAQDYANLFGYQPYALPNSELTKLEAEDRSNIWYTLNKVGKNLLNFKAWSEAIPVNNGTKTVGDNTITLTATSTDCYTKYEPSYNPEDVRIKVNPGDVITLSWNYSAGSGQSDDRVFIFGYNETDPPLSSVNALAQTGYLQYSAPANAKFCTFRLGVTTSGNTATYSNIMICHKSVYDQDSTFQPYGAPNYDLTRLQSEDRAALVEQVDEGAKNLLEIPESQTVRNSTFTKDADDWVTSDASTDYAAWTVANSNVSLNLKAGTYIVVGISHANNTATCEFSIMDSNSTEITRGGINYGQQETYTVKEFTINSAMTVYIMYKLTTQKCRFMICTKAKYNISPNYEPYTLPNTDLTQEVNALHERTDQIQEIARFRPAQAGWYRAFEMKNVVTSIAVGASDNSCSIVIKRDFANDSNEHHEIQLMAIYASNSGFTNELSKSNTLLITAIRQVVTDNNAYIDIYYAGTSGNDVACAVTNNFDVVDRQARWRVVKSLSAVPESATGETVIALHNFSANYDTSFMAAKANYNVQYGLSDGSWSCSTPNVYEYTGLSITVPANQIYEIQAYDYVSNANVLGLAIGVNSTDIDTQDYTMVAEAVDVNSASHHYLCRNVSCLSALGNAKTYYLFAKHETVGANLIALMWRRIV